MVYNKNNKKKKKKNTSNTANTNDNYNYSESRGYKLNRYLIFIKSSYLIGPREGVRARFRVSRVGISPHQTQKKS